MADQNSTGGIARLLSLRKRRKTARPQRLGANVPWHLIEGLTLMSSELEAAPVKAKKCAGAKEASVRRFARNRGEPRERLPCERVMTRPADGLRPSDIVRRAPSAVHGRPKRALSCFWSMLGVDALIGGILNSRAIGYLSRRRRVTSIERLLYGRAPAVLLLRAAIWLSRWSAARRAKLSQGARLIATHDNQMTNIYRSDGHTGTCSVRGIASSGRSAECGRGDGETDEGEARAASQAEMNEAAVLTRNWVNTRPNQILSWLK